MVGSFFLSFFLFIFSLFNFMFFKIILLFFIIFYLSIYLSIYLSVSLYLSMYLAICISTTYPLHAHSLPITYPSNLHKNHPVTPVPSVWMVLQGQLSVGLEAMPAPWDTKCTTIHEKPRCFLGFRGTQAVSCDPTLLSGNQKWQRKSTNL